LDGKLAVLIKLVKFAIWEISTLEPDAATILPRAPCICNVLSVAFPQLIILFEEGTGYPEKDMVIDPF